MSKIRGENISLLFYILFLLCIV